MQDVSVFLLFCTVEVIYICTELLKVLFCFAHQVFLAIVQ